MTADEDQKPARSPSHSPAAEGKPETGPKAKRRKVSRACVYCRRSHMTCDNNRPCMRCIKRDIGHWCRDEPREPATKRKSGSFTETNGHVVTEPQAPPPPPAPLPPPPAQTLSAGPQQDGRDLAPPPGPKEPVPHEQQPKPGVAPAIKAPVPMGGQNASGMQDWIPGLQNQFHDMHSLHPSFLFNAPEVVNEYALLNDFLNPSSMDDGGAAGGPPAGIFPGEETEGMFGPSLFGAAHAGPNMPGQQQQQQQQQQLPVQGPQQQHMQSNLMLPPGAGPGAGANVANEGNNITRPTSTAPNDKSKEAYYLTAADPAGNDNAETRMNELLQAKFKAGLLKPFNYITGYARLGKYMEKHMQPANRQKILRQLDKYRPKFRVRMEHLSDVELIKVEMWFEKCLMEYDRVFASMAMPACCWRRTGEIYRGNKELAELIAVPVEKLRDGKLSLYDIMGEDDLANYWELFGPIAFERDGKGMLTRCSLKNPDQHSRDAGIACCFSFTIRRDDHDIPSLIVGNFLPIKAR